MPAFPDYDSRARSVYVATAVAALYLNVFVLIVQSFLKIPALTALAPTQTEPPFVVLQAIALVVFAVLGVVAVRAFHPRDASAVLKPA